MVITMNGSESLAHIIERGFFLTTEWQLASEEC